MSRLLSQDVHDEIRLTVCLKHALLHIISATGLSDARIVVTGDLALRRNQSIDRAVKASTMGLEFITDCSTFQQMLLAVTFSPFIERSGNLFYNNGTFETQIRFKVESPDRMPSCSVRVKDVKIGAIPYACSNDLLLIKIEACRGVATEEKKRADAADAIVLLEKQQICLGAREKQRVNLCIKDVVASSDKTMEWWKKQLRLE